MSDYLEQARKTMERLAAAPMVTMKIDRRRSKEKMLEEFAKMLLDNAARWQARKKNPWAQYENTFQSGKHEAYADAGHTLRKILEMGK